MEDANFRNYNPYELKPNVRQPTSTLTPKSLLHGEDGEEDKEGPEFDSSGDEIHMPAKRRRP